MKKKLLLIFLFFQVTSFAQMSGTYVVGDSLDDFVLISTALDSVKLQGMSGDVQLLLRSGTYSNLYINSINDSNNYSLTITSFADDADSVIFSNGLITSSSDIYIREVSFDKNNANGNGVLEIDGGINVHIVSCNIIDNKNTNYSYGNACLKINHTWYSPSTLVYIDSCIIKARNGMPPYQANQYTIYESGGNGQTVYRSDSIIGNMDNFGSATRSFMNCYLEAATILDGNYISRIDSCEIHYHNAAYATGPKIKAGIITASTVYSAQGLGLNVSKAEDCSFFSKVSLNYTNNARMIGCDFHQKVDVTYSHGMQFIKNRFYGNIKVNIDYGTMFNNFFFGELQMIYGHVQVINNSFGPNGVLFLRSSAAYVVNNCINRIKGNIINYLNAFEYNNFADMTDIGTNYYSKYDKSPSFVDPQFVSATDLHIQNQTLYTRAKYYNYIKDDFDGEARGLHSAIGADNSCLSIPLPDTVFIDCGSKYVLKTCIDSSNTYFWKPGICLVDSNLVNPEIIVDTIKMVWLEDSAGTIIDSMYLIPSSNEVGSKRVLYAGCGTSLQLSTYVPWSATVHWIPDSLCADPYINPVTVTTTTNSQFIAIIDNGKCGISYDTIDLIIDPHPNAYFMMSSLDCTRAHFSIYALCYDSLLWDFGDGTYGNTPFVSHIFPNTGNFNIKLEVWHEGYYSTYDAWYNIWCVGVNETEITENSVKLFPNPSSNFINIEVSKSLIGQEYQCIDQTGRLLISGEIMSLNTQINVNNLAKGFYLLRLGKSAMPFIKQ